MTHEILDRDGDLVFYGNAGMEQWVIQECGAQGHVEPTPREVLSGLLYVPLQRNCDREQRTAGHLQEVQLWGIPTTSPTRRQANGPQGWAHKVSCLKQMKHKAIPSTALFSECQF